jgi:extradiol dioxygenase family protein
MPERPPFHLAFPVTDLEATRAFYRDVLGCSVGREAERWIDLDLRGHQLSAHLVEERQDAGGNAVDGDGVPVPHFGLVLEWEEWHALSDRLTKADTEFVLAPRIRFQGQVGEQATLFLRDPSGNAIELKSFKDPARLFEV